MSASAVSSTVVEERALLGFGTRGWAHLSPGSSYAEDFDEIVASVEAELGADPRLGAAVRAQAGVGRRALECAQDPEEPLARCAALVVGSARAVAEAAFPPPQWPYPDSEAAAAAPAAAGAGN